MFAQADRTLARCQGGLGIGLTLARKVVEMHGGMVEARSEGKGLGIEFSVILPTMPPSCQQAHSGSDPSPGEELGYVGKPLLPPDG